MLMDSTGSGEDDHNRDDIGILLGIGTWRLKCLDSNNEAETMLPS